MIYRLILSIAAVCSMYTAGAQSNVGPAGDAIYLANGTRYKNAQLVEITDQRVKFAVKHGETLTNHNYDRDFVLMAFTQEGNYLIIDQVSKNPVQAERQIRDFQMAPARTAPTDLLIRRVPLDVLRGLISYESEEVINYQPTSGGAASISKNELMAIFYRDGKHQILSDFNEIAPILAELRPQLSGPSSAPVVAASQPTAAVPVPEEPVAAPAPVPAAPRSSKTIASQPAKAVSTPAPANRAGAAPAPGAKVSLNEEEYVTYRAKAVQRVDEFVSYINIITDKTLSGDDKDRAIEQAIKLFMPEATIEVTSLNKSAPPRKMAVRTYLTRLKLLPYSYTKVAWSEVQYVKELTQEADGNYYGTITGQQTFTGYGKADAVTYSDVTQKNVRVKLQPYQKLIDGQNETNWQVLLGSVGVQ